MIAIGDTQLLRVPELIGPAFLAQELLPDWTDDAIAPHLGWLAPTYFDPALGRLVMSSHSWVIRTGRHVILIDTCIGNAKERPESSPLFHRAEFPYLANLAAAGIRPEEVDFVLCTHLHTDHVGWNTRLIDGRWVPTFPNAKYVFSQIERDALLARAGAPGHGDDTGIYADSVLPVIDSGQAMLVRGAEQLADVLTIEPAPGHTAGHIAIRLDSRGRSALFVGDALHHPIQIHRPDWSSSFCEDPVQARATRHRILEEAAATDTLLCPAHFAGSHCGTIGHDGNGFAYLPATPGERR